MVGWEDFLAAKPKSRGWFQEEEEEEEDPCVPNLFKREELLLQLRTTHPTNNHCCNIKSDFNARPQFLQHYCPFLVQMIAI
jgi:hypothetical protein